MGIDRGMFYKLEKKKPGRPRKHTIREILNGIFYVIRTGCQWRYLPHDFPNCKTVYEQFIPSCDLNISNYQIKSSD
jgi:transposase